MSVDSLLLHFESLARIPRPSGQETAVIDWLRHLAEVHGLTHESDATGNLVIRKASTPGHEQAPGVVLQGHVDMVTQKRPDSDHDFRTDAIQLVRKGDWLHAEGTTLGADNGIGCAAAMAVLTATDLVHGPLEALFTIEEETGLRGARELDGRMIQGRLLLNLDSEDDRELTIGCAGGADISASGPFDSQPCNGDPFWRVEVGGLMGGHSGLDIHKPRANAIRLMARLVQALAERHHFHFVSMQGGDLRNAIPRNASALFQGPAAGFNDFRNLVRKATARFRADFVEETGLDIQVAPTDERTSHRPTREATRQLMQILMDCPFGVHAWADHLDGVPETSNNLTPVRIADGRIEMGLMLRSLVDSARDALADNIVRFLEDAGLEAHRGGVYPGWQPDPDSPLLKRAVACYRQVNGHDPEIRVIHAGLECGLIGAARPGMEMISFGPVILGAHSPDERLSLPSTEKFWIFLVALLADLARS